MKDIQFSTCRCEYFVYVYNFITGLDTATGQNVAMMTKIDPLDALYRSDERVSYPIPGSSCPSSSATGTQGVSKHFRSRFRIDGLSQDLSIFNLHFLAFPDDTIRCRRREGQREAERSRKRAEKEQEREGKEQEDEK